MGRSAGILVMLLVTVFAVAACGTSGSGDQSNPPENASPENASTTRTLPEAGEISAGSYRTEKFEAPFSFEVGEGWSSSAPEVEQSVFLEAGEGNVLSFDSPHIVFDPKKPLEEIEKPAPDTVNGWVAWTKSSPYFETSNPKPASLGGASGVRFDLVVASAPKKSTELCEVPCVPAYRIGPSELDKVALYLGDEEQNYVLEVGDEIVSVIIAAPKGELAEFLPEAQKVLNTVEWKAES